MPSLFEVSPFAAIRPVSTTTASTRSVSYTVERYGFMNAYVVARHYRRMLQISEGSTEVQHMLIGLTIALDPMMMTLCGRFAKPIGLDRLGYSLSSSM